MPQSTIAQLKSPGVKWETSSSDHMLLAETQPHNRSSSSNVLFPRVWRETRHELMCLDISLFNPPSAPSLMKRLPESSPFSVEQHWRWQKAPHHLFQHWPWSNRSSKIKVHGLYQLCVHYTETRKQNKSHTNPHRGNTFTNTLKHSFLSNTYTQNIYRVKVPFRGSREHLIAWPLNLPSRTHTNYAWFFLFLYLKLNKPLDSFALWGIQVAEGHK